jgi:hypothetical protein
MQGRRTSWSSLFFGLVFLGVSALLLTGQVGLVSRLRWAGPILLILIALSLIGWAVAERPRPVPGAARAAYQPVDRVGPGDRGGWTEPGGSPGPSGRSEAGGPEASGGQVAPGDAEDPPSPAG